MMFNRRGFFVADPARSTRRGGLAATGYAAEAAGGLAAHTGCGGWRRCCGAKRCNARCASRSRLRLSNAERKRLAAMAGPVASGDRQRAAPIRDGVQAVVDRLLLRRRGRARPRRWPPGSRRCCRCRAAIWCRPRRAPRPRGQPQAGGIRDRVGGGGVSRPTASDSRPACSPRRGGGRMTTPGFRQPRGSEHLDGYPRIALIEPLLGHRIVAALAGMVSHLPSARSTTVWLDAGHAASPRARRAVRQRSGIAPAARDCAASGR